MKDRHAVLITGGAKRVGAALSLYFAEHGYDIALHYNRSVSEARVLQKKIEALGRKCVLFAHDLNDVKGMTALLKQVKKAMPHCTTLINNASIIERAMFLKTDEALFDRQFAVNFKAPFFMTQTFAKIFGRGCVINIVDTDISGTHGSHFAYLLSKKALAEFTAMAARALGPGLRVSGVCPGTVLPASAQDKQYMEKLSRTVPLHKLATPKQVAEAAFFLCSNTSITGQLIFTDGGQHLL